MQNPEMIPIKEEKNTKVAVNRTTFMVENELWKVVSIEKIDNKMVLNLEKI